MDELPAPDEFPRLLDYNMWNETQSEGTVEFVNLNIELLQLARHTYGNIHKNWLRVGVELVYKTDWKLCHGITNV
jgi:hypothetical protein